MLTLEELHIETLQAFIEASDGLVLADTAITLEALHMFGRTDLPTLKGKAFLSCMQCCADAA
jgi:hypothetical protein